MERGDGDERGGDAGAPAEQARASEHAPTRAAPSRSSGVSAAAQEATDELLELETFASVLDLPLDDIDPAVHYQLPSPEREPSSETSDAAAIAERIAAADKELLAAQELRQREQAQQEAEDHAYEQEQEQAHERQHQHQQHQQQQQQAEPEGKGEEQAGAEASSAQPMRALVWFRRDLRVHDNLALHTALKRLAEAHSGGGGGGGAGGSLLLLYTVHRPRIMLCGANRFQFMLESVADLSAALAARGARLLVARGDGEAVLRRVLPAWGVSHLFFDAASEPFAIARDERVVALAQRLGARVEVTRGYTLYDLNAVLACNGGKPPKTYTSFLRSVALFPAPAEPLPAPAELPPAALSSSPRELLARLTGFWSRRAAAGEDEEPEETAALLAGVAGPARDFGVPALAEFGFSPPRKHPFIFGGEQAALRILDEYCASEARVVRFEKPKTSPAETEPSASTTSLSPFMYFGCLSPRTFFHRVHEIQERHKQAASAPPVSLDGQLLWREFFHCHGRANPFFDKMEENPLCLQIDWRWHAIPATEAELTDDDRLARAQFEAWKEGQTGYPWIDAIMIQLRDEGWMHHLARHSVACFLTRGDLYISWVRGLEVFQERLIDHDWNINAGNWLWLSSSAFFTAYFRVYSPSTFGKKWDPDGKFIRKYLPVLANMPPKYIYEPWKAPMAVQRAAGCLVGKDYPFPIVDHKIALRRCLAGMKASYAAGQYGVPPTPAPPAGPLSPRHKRQREGSSSGSDDDKALEGGAVADA